MTSPRPSDAALDKAATEVAESSEDPTPARVVARSRGNRIACPNPEAEVLPRQQGIDKPEGGSAGREEPNDAVGTDS